MIEKDSCPLCGSLPCDWVNDPHQERDIIFMTLARIREVTGVGEKPMLTELPEAIAAHRIASTTPKDEAIAELVGALEATTHEVEATIRCVTCTQTKAEMQAVADNARALIAKHGASS